ncbi:MAG: class II fructose-bisphosphate aldolase [Actinobacteria bacterium]|nr:class II fructose-bisphosphate aldolase [Actinomycetota bacterium]
MGLVNLDQILANAKSDGYAVGSFNVINVETLEGVMDAANQSRSPVIVAIYEGHFPGWVSIEMFTRMVSRVAERVSIPVTLHLDHAQTLDSIIKAIKCGFTSVMFDGFDLSYEEKVEQTKEVVKIAHAIGCTVEAELGHVSRVGQTSKHTMGVLADPDIAEDFAQKTGVDILAVSIGNVHGMAEQTTSLQIERLIQIRKQVGCYLSLHGGSGVSNDEFRRAIQNGINKISYFTRLTLSAIDRIKKTLAREDNVILTELMGELRESFRDSVIDRIALFGSSGVCTKANSLCAKCASCSNYSAEKPKVGLDNHQDLVKIIGDIIARELSKRI